MFNLVGKLNGIAWSCTILLVLFHWQAQSNLISLMIEFDVIHYCQPVWEKTKFHSIATVGFKIMSGFFPWVLGTWFVKLLKEFQVL